MLNEPEREGAGPGGPNHDLTTETGATPTACPLLDIGPDRWSCLSMLDRGHRHEPAQGRSG